MKRQQDSDMEWRQRVREKARSATTRNQGRVPKCGENKRELPEGAPDQSKRLKYDVDASVQQDAIAKYRQLKAMKMAGKPIPKVAKQRHQK